MFADCLGLPISVAEAQETGALGAAIGVANAIGIYKNYEEAVDHMTRPKSSYEPDPAMKSHYDQRYAQFQTLCDAMKGFWVSIPAT
jgi:L-xylulokinase